MEVKGCHTTWILQSCKHYLMPLLKLMIVSKLKLQVITGSPGNTEFQIEVCHWRKTKYQLLAATANTKLKLVMQNSTCEFCLNK